jgi:DNA topoisomerase VI subunit A
LRFPRIKPSDIDSIDMTQMTLTEGDLKKVDDLLKRPYITADLQRELNIFKERQLKAEIEAMYFYSIEYLINDFIPRKIRRVLNPFFNPS